VGATGQNSSTGLIAGQLGLKQVFQGDALLMTSWEEGYV
jgi:hypothetical protein